MERGETQPENETKFHPSRTQDEMKPKLKIQRFIRPEHRTKMKPKLNTKQVSSVQNIRRDETQTRIQKVHPSRTQDEMKPKQKKIIKHDSSVQNMGRDEKGILVQTPRRDEFPKVFVRNADEPRLQNQLNNPLPWTRNAKSLIVQDDKMIVHNFGMMENDVIKVTPMKKDKVN